MDTDFDTTQARYEEFLKRAPELLATTLKNTTDTDRTQLAGILAHKKRLFFTGTGSSMPAAWYGAYVMTQAGYPAQFLPTGAILGLHSLSKDDIVILSSQGINRADALLVIDTVANSPADLVVLTANRGIDLKGKAAAVYYFDPAEEKLFCRPAGVATNYALMAKLLASSEQALTDQTLVDAWREGATRPLELPADCSRYIVLSSDAMMPVAWNVALALREGSGLLTQLFDIETYGHGNYVSDLYNRQPGNTFGYIFVGAAKTTETARSIRRFEPFAKSSNIPYTIIAPGYEDAARAGLSILASVSAKVFALNTASGYNMNRPPGKEENRYYHELESYDN